MGEYYNLKIKNIVKETKDAISVYLRQPILSSIKYKSGQFLTLVMEVEGKEYRRAYSLNSAPKIDSDLCITIKRVKDGTVSNLLYEKLKVGDSLKIMKPMGNFVFEAEKHLARHTVLFGGGSGITPLMSILKSCLFFELQSYITLIYCNRDLESVIFQDQLKELQNTFADRLNIIHILENPPSDWEGGSGRINRASLKQLLEELPVEPGIETEYYICGPSGMIEEVMEGLYTMNVPESKIKIESFIPLPSKKDPSGSEETILNREVCVQYKNKDYTVNVKAGTYILDAALDDGVKLPYSCLSGICGSCKGKCVTGKVKMKKGHILSESEIQEGFVLPCVSQPLTDDVTIKM